MRALMCVLGGLSTAVLLLSATGAAGAIPKSCPSASVVGATLGTAAKTPTKTQSTYVLTCKYGTTALAPKVEFQTDTAATFAAGEKAANASLPVAKISHLGKAAWGTKSGGLLEVFTGSYTIKILSPLTPLTKLEALARKLL